MSSTVNYTAEINELREAIKQMEKDFADNDNAFFLCSMSLIIFFMQCGFAFLEAGAVRSKNTTNILIKNLLDSCISVIGYWSLGWAFAFGDSSNSVVGLFIGHTQFFLSGLENYSMFFYQYAFAATSATIVSGAVAERCEFANYIVYSTLISTVVYPILTHWGWHKDGWMHRGIDFSGAGVVHLCGGVISLAAAYIIGPRIGRFSKDGKGEPLEIKGHSVPFVALGGFILMFGFLGFNAGSMGDIAKKGEGEIVALAMVNTILCGAFGALTFLIIHYLTKGKWTLLLTINACLAGMVASCAGCNNMEPWASSFTGIGAGLVYLGLSNMLIKMKIDDPLDAFAVHGGGGLWGMVSASIINRNGVAYAIANAITSNNGPLYCRQAFAQLGWQLICALAITIWSLIWMIPIFLFLKKIGKLRVAPEIEINGLDIYKHGEAAYPLHAYGHGWDEYEPIKDKSMQNYGRLIGNTESGHQLLLDQFLNRTDKRLGSIANGYSSSQYDEERTRARSIYINPSNYEHPEHHSSAKMKIRVPKPVKNKPNTEVTPRTPTMAKSCGDYIANEAHEENSRNIHM
ncbi:ammonium transporter Amt1 [Parelaphostrongylus tenuis]|uniref:Ammonium transporter n=1 Tax=Parelaphostrongylus tenuis TaxID=148309 RepID=A0AAD5QN07_PARTN|nr:ammonium transporter Amt1 [Parelaphostrongylus tenuis]